MPNVFTSLPDKAASFLETLAKSLQGVVPTETRCWNIDVAGLSNNRERLQVLGEVNAWANSDSVFLYYFLLKGEADLKVLAQHFSEAKAREKDERAYARLNGESKYLYVGSSLNIAQRLKEHLGCGAKKTYALQLMHWMPKDTGQIEFVCAKYPCGTSPDSLQALEDALWDQLKPMFGRKGKR